MINIEVEVRLQIELLDRLERSKDGIAKIGGKFICTVEIYSISCGDSLFEKLVGGDGG